MNWEQSRFSRADRVGDQLQQELARVIQREMKDPRVRFVTLSGVKVSKDLAYADVYYSVMPGQCLDDVRGVLKTASGFLRTAVAKRMMLRVVPALRFHFDNTTNRGRELSDLIDQAIAEDKRRTDS